MNTPNEEAYRELDTSKDIESTLYQARDFNSTQILH